jgi:hypothetical protein
MRFICTTTYNGHYNDKIVLDFFLICVRVFTNVLEKKIIL